MSTIPPIRQNLHQRLQKKHLLHEMRSGLHSLNKVLLQTLMECHGGMSVPSKQLHYPPSPATPPFVIGSTPRLSPSFGVTLPRFPQSLKKEKSTPGWIRTSDKKNYEFSALPLSYRRINGKGGARTRTNCLDLK